MMNSIEKRCDSVKYSLKKDDYSKVLEYTDSFIKLLSYFNNKIIDEIVLLKKENIQLDLDTQSNKSQKSYDLNRINLLPNIDKKTNISTPDR